MNFGVSPPRLLGGDPTFLTTPTVRAIGQGPSAEIQPSPLQNELAFQEVRLFVREGNEQELKAGLNTTLKKTAKLLGE